MKRGQVLPVVIPGYGKPRPAIIMQSDLLFDTDSILVLPLTTTIRSQCAYRPDVHTTAANGLRENSQAMADKVTVISRTKCGEVIGAVDEETMGRINGAVAFALGFMD